MISIRHIRVFKTVYCKLYTTNQSNWDIMASICLQRKPIITRSLTDIDREYQKILHEIEFERSLKSGHEMRHDKDIKRMENLKKGKVNDLDIDQAASISAQDYVDMNKEELTTFKFASRITEADKQNNCKSLNRKLENNLILICKQKLGHDSFWLLPQGLLKKGETLRQSAERVLKESCGDNLKARFYGNAPCGFYKFKYPKEKREQSGVEGAKIFFYKARLLEVQFDNKYSWENYEWATEQEIVNKFVQPYIKSVKLFLSNNIVTV
ncbi:39S ribosomal protein L46, mitochondrial [Adelges cooleyi]|uniref:39S ribosomal protein L46, mitochondrial n=1 Tax=Adelges cooleyi TaxID=133065 RepID=UPI00217F57C6|nr:39S ribosomal protein L46, mitochondrial [Adelges cooleyi]